jgi:hypothetical protein
MCAHLSAALHRDKRWTDTRENDVRMHMQGARMNIAQAIPQQNQLQKLPE